MRELAGQRRKHHFDDSVSDERPSQAISVLLVEDDAPTLWRLQDALTSAGFQVTAAGTLAEARAYLAAARQKCC